MEFIRQFSASLLAAGGRTTRVDRTASRIARAYGYDVELAIFTRHYTLSIYRMDNPDRGRHTAVCPCAPDSPNFAHVTQLNRLSWRIADEGLPLDAAWREYATICALPGINPLLLPLLVACANACFCGLFAGDAVAMAFTGVATWLAFNLRQKLLYWGMDAKLTFFLCALVASLVASLDLLLHVGSTPQTGMAASVLFLIPGVPLINSMMDLLDGHFLMGIARFLHAGILILCIALGLGVTMMLVGVTTL